MTKKTKKEMFTELLSLVEGNEEMTEFINHELELLANKSSVNKKPTKTQLENDAFKAEIVTFLATADSPKTLKEIQAGVNSLADLTCQRITHMLTALVSSGSIEKTYIKKVAYFSLSENLPDAE